jgi:hypothetical protein
MLLVAIEVGCKMSSADPFYRLSVDPDCIEAFNDLKLGKKGTKYIIYKISDNMQEIVVDEVGTESEYDIFREKLQSAKDAKGNSRPSYAVYDVAFDLDGGEGHRLVSMWSPAWSMADGRTGK